MSDEKPTQRTNAPRRRAKQKNFPLEQDFLEALTDARRRWYESEPDVHWNAFGGIVSETAFLQMVARLGMDALEHSADAKKTIWEHVPTNARGYRGHAS